MKKIIFQFLILPFSVYNMYSQNLLSPIWKISFTDTVTARQINSKSNSYKEVNLLLSWERQNFFWQDGTFCLVNDFIIPAMYRDSTFHLTLSLQCDVESIYINGRRISGKMPNPFWSHRGAKTSVVLPDSCIFTGRINRIAIVGSGLSYTGGKSYNFCQISPLQNVENSKVEIIIPADDHLFFIDQKDITVKIKHNTRNKGVLRFTIKNDFQDTLINKTYDVDEGEGEITVDLAGEKFQPGFYECIAILKSEGYAGDVKWFALSPEKIKCETDTVAGFKSYWDTALNELKIIKPDFNLIKVDSLSMGKRDGYIVEMKSLGNLIIRGYYFVPRTGAPYPAILHLPYYSQDFQPLDPFLQNKENVAELALCVRGHGISTDVFHPGFGIPGIWGYKLCSESKNAYRSIYMDCVRAVEFLVSRPEIDSGKIGVMGGSQGGGLTLVTAGLCKDRISACAYFDPFPCDIRDHMRIRKLINKEFQTFLNYYNNECTLKQALHIQDLIDSKGFANWVECPVYFGTALFDDDCPPHIGFAAYNLIKAPKQYRIYPDDSHLGESNPYKEFMKFFKEQFEF
jgi:cephalosporin-C deacetylase-like acetyl esterase